MGSWQFQYWNGSAWINFQNAQIDHIMEELSSLSGGNAAGQEESVFDIPNTAANRATIQALPFAIAGKERAPGLFRGNIQTLVSC